MIKPFPSDRVGKTIKAKKGEKMSKIVSGGQIKASKVVTHLDQDGQLAIGDHEILLDDWFVRARALGESMIRAGKGEKNGE